MGAALAFLVMLGVIMALVQSPAELRGPARLGVSSALFDKQLDVLGLPHEGGLRVDATFRKEPYSVYMASLVFCMEVAFDEGAVSEDLRVDVTELEFDLQARTRASLDALGPDAREAIHGILEHDVGLRLDARGVVALWFPHRHGIESSDTAVTLDGVREVRAHLIALRHAVRRNRSPEDTLYALATDPRSSGSVASAAARRLIDDHPEHLAREVLTEARPGLRPEARIASALCMCRSRDELFDAFHDAAHLDHDAFVRRSAIALYLEPFPWPALHDDALDVSTRARIARAALDAAPDDHEDDLVSLILGLSHRPDVEGHLMSALLEHGWDPSPDAVLRLARSANARQLTHLARHLEKDGRATDHPGFVREINLRGLAYTVRLEPLVWGIHDRGTGQLSVAHDDAHSGALTQTSGSGALSQAVESGGLEAADEEEESHHG